MNDLIIDVQSRSITVTASKFLGVPADKVCELLRQVWATSNGQPPLTNAEMFVGLSMIARFGLDPIAREVYVTRTKRGLCTIVGIDGWIKILERTEGFDGFEQELHTGPDGAIDWCETRIYTTRRSRPTTYRAFASEYNRICGPVAASLPSHMLRIFSLRHAARLFTPVGGSVVTEEEARWMDAYGKEADQAEQPKRNLLEKVKSAGQAIKALEQPQQPQEQPEPDPDPEQPQAEQTAPFDVPEAQEARLTPEEEAQAVDEYKQILGEQRNAADLAMVVTEILSGPTFAKLRPDVATFVREMCEGQQTRMRQSSKGNGRKSGPS